MLPGPSLGFDGELHGFAVGQRAPSRSPEKFKSLPFRIPAHLLESLDRDERRERLPFPLDHKFVLRERDTIDHVADPLTKANRRHFLGHEPARATISPRATGISAALLATAF
jgi:hypothetical protein